MWLWTVRGTHGDSSSEDSPLGCLIKNHVLRGRSRGASSVAPLSTPRVPAILKCGPLAAKQCAQCGTRPTEAKNRAERGGLRGVPTPPLLLWLRGPSEQHQAPLFQISRAAAKLASSYVSAPSSPARGHTFVLGDGRGQEKRVSAQGRPGALAVAGPQLPQS